MNDPSIGPDGKKRTPLDLYRVLQNLTIASRLIDDCVWMLEELLGIDLFDYPGGCCV